MQHLMHADPQLALALGYLKEKEMRTDRARNMKQASIQEKALQALHVKVEEAPVETIFDQPKIQDAEILLRITPDQVQRSEEALTLTVKKISSHDKPTNKSLPPEDVQRRASTPHQHTGGKGGRARQ